MPTSIDLERVNVGELQPDPFHYVRERGNLLFSKDKRRAISQFAKSANGQVQALPILYQAGVINDLLEEFEKEAYRSGPYVAAQNLEKNAKVTAGMMPCGLFLNSDDDAIKLKAETISKNIEHKCNRMIRDFNDTYGDMLKQGREDEAIHVLAENMYQQARRSCNVTGIEAAPVRANNPVTIHYMASVRRAWCPKWWRRRLRREHARYVENYGRGLGRVRRDRDCYVTEEAIRTRKDQRLRNDNILEGLIAYCEETGETVGLDACAAASVSDPTNRRNETMARLRGMHEHAKDAGDAVTFWTITAPSRFHVWSTIDGANHVYAYNKNYDGSTPAEVQAHLCQVWSRARAEFKRRELMLYGFRVAEPHHDGCPHWHMLVFGKAEHVAEASEIMREYALQDSPDETGAQQHRFKNEPLDVDGSPIGYVAKYIAKNLDGKGMDGMEDEEGLTISSALERVDAWRSLWGIRQFQFFGFGSITIWRELRKIKEKPEGAIFDAWSVAHSADFSSAAGGVCWKKFIETIKFKPITMLKQALPERGAYGELVDEVLGLECCGTLYETRGKRWQIVDRRQAMTLGLVSITVRDEEQESSGEPPPT